MLSWRIPSKTQECPSLAQRNPFSVPDRLGLAGHQTTGHRLQALNLALYALALLSPWLPFFLPFFHQPGGESIGCQAVTQYQVQAQPLKNSQARQSPRQRNQILLAEAAYLSHGDEDKKPKTREDPVSLNNAATTQDKGPPSLRSCLERTTSNDKELGKEMG